MTYKVGFWLAIGDAGVVADPVRGPIPPFLGVKYCKMHDVRETKIRNRGSYLWSRSVAVHIIDYIHNRRCGRTISIIHSLAMTMSDERLHKIDKNVRYHGLRAFEHGFGTEIWRTVSRKRWVHLGTNGNEQGLVEARSRLLAGLLWNVSKIFLKGEKKITWFCDSDCDVYVHETNT